MTVIDRICKAIHTLSSSLSLLMVLVTFVVVVARYFFSSGWVWLQESVTYMHAILFLSSAAYTLRREGHVRVDLFYRAASVKTKAILDCIGILIFLLPSCAVLFYFSWPYVLASWQVFEGSQHEGGLNAVFILKSFILIFSGLVFLQGLSLLWFNIKRIHKGTLA